MTDLKQPARLGPPAVAILLGISERTLTRWVQQGRFPKPIMFGRARHWEKPAVESWINAAREASMK